MFASNTPSKYLPDHFDGDGCVFGDGREHFTPRQRNEPNPILLDIRRYHAERSRMNQPKGWHRVLRVFNAAADYGHFVTGDWERITSPEYIEHARRVLTRLAALTESRTP